MLKVIGGKYRSRKLEAPSFLTVPSKAMVREALGSALSRITEGAVVLDLFAGSGALGIEMLSRGAEFVTFVDLSPDAISCIKKNLASLNESRFELFNADYLSVLQETQRVYDIVFLDPPYKGKEYYKEAVDYIIKKNILSPNGAIVIEYEGELEDSPYAFLKMKEYRYGRSKIRILWR